MKTTDFARLSLLMCSVTLAGCAAGDNNYQFSFGGKPISGTQNGTAFERGKSHLEAGQIGLAVNHLQMAVNEDPSSIPALNALAAAYDRIGRYELSARYYKRALAFDPHSPQTLNNLGYSYLLQGRTDLAVAFLREASELDAANPVVSTNRQIAEAALNTEPSEQQVAEAQPEQPQTGHVTTGPSLSIVRTSAKVHELVRRAPGTDDGPDDPALRRLLLDRYTADQVASEQVNQLGAEIPIGDLTYNTAAAVELTNIAPTSNATEARDEAPADVVSPQETGAFMLAAASYPPAALSSFPATSEEPMLAAVSYPGVAATPLAAEPDPKPVEDTVYRMEEPPHSETPPGQVIYTAYVPAMPDPPVIERKARVAYRSADDSKEAPSTEVDVGTGPTLELSNGAGRRHMAARMRGYLEGQGVQTSWLTNADNFRHMESTIYYRRGWLESAMELERQLPVDITLQEVDSQRADVRLEIGGDLLDFDADLYYGRLPSGSSQRT